MNKSIEIVFHFTLLLTLVIFTPAAAVDKVAEVAGEPITWLEFQKRYENLWEEYQEDRTGFKEFSQNDYHNQLQILALKQLIEEKLFEIYAKENDITITQNEIDAYFRSLYSSQSYFLTNGKFDEDKYNKFKQEYPFRYERIVEEIKKDFGYDKIKKIIMEQYQINDDQLYHIYIRQNSKIKLKYMVVPDSLMPLRFPSTPFYLKEYYKENKSNYKNLQEVKINFIYIDDKDFLPEANSYQQFIANYKNAAHEKAEDYADKLIQKLQISNTLQVEGKYVFTTDFLQLGDKIGNLENGDEIVVKAHNLNETEINEYPIETKNGWIIFQTEKLRKIKSDNLYKIALKIWQDYIENGKGLYFDNLVRDYYKKMIAPKDVYSINFDYLEIPLKKLDFKLIFDEDTTTVKKYYEKNIQEYVTVRDTLPLEKIREDVIEDLLEDTTKTLTDSLIDTLVVQLKNGTEPQIDSFTSINSIYDQQIIDGLPYFRDPLPFLLDTLSHTKEDSIFRINKNDYVYLGRVNRRKKLSPSRKKRLKPKIEELFREKLYQERDEKFQQYYQSNRNSFYEKDSYKFQFLYVPIDTSNIEISEEDVQQYYNQNQNKITVPEKVKLSTIYLPEERSKEIESIQSALEHDVSFDFISAYYSTKNKLVDKNNQYIKTKTLKPEIRDSLKNIEIGEISSVIKTKNGSYIIKLLGRERTYLPQYENVKEELKLEVKKEKADSLTFKKIVAIYDSLESNPYYEKYDSLGYVRTTDWIEIKDKQKVILDSNLTIPAADIEIINRTGLGKMLPKIFKVNNGYAIVKIVSRIPGEQISGYESYSKAKDNFYKVYRYNQCRIFTDSLINYSKTGNDTIVKYLGGFRKTGWLSYSDKIDDYRNSNFILFDAFSRKEGSYSNPIRFSDTAFGFYKVLNKKIEDIENFKKIKEEYRKEYLQKRYQNWLDEYRKSHDVIILDKSLRQVQ